MVFQDKKTCPPISDNCLFFAALKALTRLNPYLYKYRRRLALGIVFVTASNLFAIFPAQLVRNAIDLIKDLLLSYPEKGEAVKSELSSSILYFAGLTILFAVIRGLFMYLMRQTLIVMSRHIEFDLKNEIYRHYQELDPVFYARQRTGDLMARISEDVSRVRMYVGPAIMYAINLCVTIVLVLGVMFTVNARLTWLVILPLPVLSYAIFRINNLINERSDAIQAQLSALTSQVQEAFSGIRVLKAFAAEPFANRNMDAETTEYRKRQLSLAKVDAFFFPLMVFLVGLSSLITIYVGGIEVIEGRATLGNIAEFVIYVNLLTWPVTSLGYTSSLIQRAAASQARINEFLDAKPELSYPEDVPFEFGNHIQLESVTYTYPEKQIPALNNVSLQLKKGSTTAVLGTTGSGKTTLIQLLLRSFDPGSGKITIDGKPLSGINLKAYYRHTGYVPQDVFLFSDTLRNNILFGLESGSDDIEAHLDRACKMAMLEDVIRTLPEGLETRIGERGITLSGGQKQRVAIARALIRNPEILILDDCLSALDTHTESMLLENLKHAGTGKTVLIVSHRVSSVRNAHQIMVLDEGHTLEMGSHEELLAQNGLYASIYVQQTEENMPFEG